MLRALRAEDEILKRLTVDGFARADALMEYMCTANCKLSDLLQYFPVVGVSFDAVKNDMRKTLGWNFTFGQTLKNNDLRVAWFVSAIYPRSCLQPDA